MAQIRRAAPAPVKVRDPHGRAVVLEGLPRLHALALVLIVRLSVGEQGCQIDSH